MALEPETRDFLHSSVGLSALAGGSLAFVRVGRVFEGHQAIQNLCLPHPTEGGKFKPYSYYAAPANTVVEVMDQDGKIIAAYRYPRRWLKPPLLYFQIVNSSEWSGIKTFAAVERRLLDYGLRPRPFERWYRRREFLQQIVVVDGVECGNTLLKAQFRNWRIWSRNINGQNPLAVGCLLLMGLAVIEIGSVAASGSSSVGKVSSILGVEERGIAVSEIFAGLALASFGGWSGLALWGGLMGVALKIEIFS